MDKLVDTQARAVVKSHVPEHLLTLFEMATVIGVGGSRDPGEETRGMCAIVFPYLASETRAAIYVGDAGGVDLHMRTYMRRSPRLRLFGITPGEIRTADKLIRRTAACVGGTAAHTGALWLSFPDKPCQHPNRRDDVLLPDIDWRRCFRGFGGSWGGLALARGLALRCVVWLPDGVQPPEHTAWGFRDLGGGWFFAQSQDTTIEISREI